MHSAYCSHMLHPCWPRCSCWQALVAFASECATFRLQVSNVLHVFLSRTFRIQNASLLLFSLLVAEYGIQNAECFLVSACFPRRLDRLSTSSFLLRCSLLVSPSIPIPIPLALLASFPGWPGLHHPVTAMLCSILVLIELPALLAPPPPSPLSPAPS